MLDRYGRLTGPTCPGARSTSIARSQRAAETKETVRVAADGGRGDSVRPGPAGTGPAGLPAGGTRPRHAGQPLGARPQGSGDRCRPRRPSLPRPGRLGPVRRPRARLAAGAEEVAALALDVVGAPGDLPLNL